VILIGEKSTDAEKAAAAEFATYWKQVTGYGVLAAKKPLKNLGMNVWIGHDVAPEELLAYAKCDGLGEEGFCIKTARRKKKGVGHMLIAGETPAGTVNGVYQFIEDYLGVRFLSPDTTYVPTKCPDFIPEISVKFAPKFSRRDGTYDIIGTQGIPDDQRAAFARHMRWNSKPDYPLTLNTTFALLPPDKYFAEHPDFYGEVAGKRVAPLGIDLMAPENMATHFDLRSQVCFSNPNAAEAIAEELKPLMKATPDKKIWSVSQMDWDVHCSCDRCRELEERESSAMAPLLTCVNRVADLIKSEFPDNFIETRAYKWTRKPPRSITPHDNVIITLSAEECDYSRPITDSGSPANASFASDLAAWSKISHNLYLWDYPANNYFSLIPYPNFNALGENYAFYAQHNIRGVFQSGGAGLTEDFGALRCYMLSRLMWKPDSDAHALMTEFLDAYYEDAAPQMREYIELMNHAARVKSAQLRPKDTGAWIDSDTLAKAEEIFKQAVATAKNDPVKARIEDAYTSLRYCSIVCPPKVEVKDGKFTATRPACMSVDDFLKHIQARGYKPFEAAPPLPDYVMARTGKAAPPRAEESPLEVLENDNFLVWIAPAMKGSVLRVKDKRSGADFLRGFERGSNGVIQDWRNAQGQPEGPNADAYEVADRKPDSVTLRAKRDDGMVIDRAITLKPGADAIEITLTATNASDKSLPPAVKLHPEFDTFGEPFEVLLSKDGHWTPQGDLKTIGAGQGKLDKLDGETALALRLPMRGSTLSCAFDPKEIGGLKWTYEASNEARHCSLELLSKPDPIKPGEKAAMHATYSVFRGQPVGM
jgi:hypothetical protein